KPFEEIEELKCNFTNFINEIYFSEINRSTENFKIMKNIYSLELVNRHNGMVGTNPNYNGFNSNGNKNKNTGLVTVLDYEYVDNNQRVFNVNMYSDNDEFECFSQMEFKQLIELINKDKPNEIKNVIKNKTGIYIDNVMLSLIISDIRKYQNNDINSMSSYIYGESGVGKSTYPLLLAKILALNVIKIKNSFLINNCREILSHAINGINSMEKSDKIPITIVFIDEFDKDINNMLEQSIKINKMLDDPSIGRIDKSSIKPNPHHQVMFSSSGAQVSFDDLHKKTMIKTPISNFHEHILFNIDNLLDCKKYIFKITGNKSNTEILNDVYDFDPNLTTIDYLFQVHRFSPINFVNLTYDHMMKITKDLCDTTIDEFTIVENNIRTFGELKNFIYTKGYNMSKKISTTRRE
ncbi:MAG: AAA family ATPase, partial [Candidatus Riesia sp.]|nr:AAA family ATPase [Candidatus Riesia sp.]